MQLHLTPLLDWYKHNGRNLPWRNANTAYKIWVSEIFLQQTQVNRVIEFYDKMLKKYPTVQDLANSNWEEFFPYFKGLGFYSRGKNMLLCAKEVVNLHNGVFVNDIKILQTLPGIGEYTAHAISSFFYKNSVPALDVNLYRVLRRVLDFSDNISKNIIKDIAFNYFAKQTGETAQILNHSLMDIGSRFCTAKKVDCKKCPLQKNCLFYINKKEIKKVAKNPTQITKNINIAKIYSVMLLRNNKKYLLEYDIKNKIWKFPEFLRELNHVNNRHFLQKTILQKFKIEISVRPIFWKEQSFKNKKYTLHEFSRCQIQSEEKQFLNMIQNYNYNYKFLDISDIQKLYFEKKLQYYSEEFYEKINKMRI